MRPRELKARWHAGCSPKVRDKRDYRLRKIMKEYELNRTARLGLRGYQKISWQSEK